MSARARQYGRNGGWHSNANKEHDYEVCLQNADNKETITLSAYAFNEFDAIAKAFNKLAEQKHQVDKFNVLKVSISIDVG